MLKKAPQYQAYVLRFWEESNPQAPETIWRFSLEDPRTGQRRGFSNLETLHIALQEELTTLEKEAITDEQEKNGRNFNPQPTGL
ncbi:MAG: hypothetical protein AAF485_05565 [Chloroflexota bacterium]